MYMYCEKIIFNRQTNSYDVLLDFNSIDDLLGLRNLFQISNSGPNKSLLYLSNLKFDKYKGFRSGNWYSLNHIFFSNLERDNSDQFNDNSRILAKLKPRNNDLLNVWKYKVKNKKLYIDNTGKTIDFKASNLFGILSELMIPTNLIEDAELIVRDVGCGNWNEINSNYFHLMYDLGGDIKFNDKEMDSIITNIPFEKPYVAIISHWDLDHYRAILDLSDVQLRLMRGIAVPSMMPLTVQLTNTLKRLDNLNIKIDIISPAIKKGKTIDLISQGKINGIELYRSCDGAKINQSGIVLTIDGTQKTAVLTGDHHYPQLLNSIFSTSAIKPYELVVPHHGGAAGTFDLNKWNVIDNISGALSTKSKRYSNLPLKVIHDFFVKNSAFHCTECDSMDYRTSI